MFLKVEGVCADESVQLGALICQRRGTMQHAPLGSKTEQKGEEGGCFEEAVIYCTLNSPGIAGLAQTQGEQHLGLSTMLPGYASSG